MVAASEWPRSRARAGDSDYPCRLRLPLITAALPGTGGRIRADREDFEVEEIPAYGPDGEGDHVIAWIEKRGLSTFELIHRLAAATGIDAASIGTAGLKDKDAVTRQQVSLPPPVSPEAVLALEIEGARVLSVGRHRRKLRTGHLRGNRFRIRIRDVEDDGAARAGAILEALAVAPGSPNLFGAQRFGRSGDNARVARDILAGTHQGKRPRGRQLRLLLSALQSELFNRYLTARIAAGAYRTVLAGDILKKTDTGGVFATTEPEIDQGRLLRGELVPTGPMFGAEMRSPEPGTAAAGLEAEILGDADVDPAWFSRFARLTPGTRRPIAVVIGDPGVNSIDGPDIEVTFTLPAGAYATVVLSEIIKDNPPRAS